VVALLGENGAGKTTLDEHPVRPLHRRRGQVEAFGKRCRRATRAPRSAGIGMVHQHFTLADQMSVLENIVLGTQGMWSLQPRQIRARASASTLSARFRPGGHPDRADHGTVGRRAQRVEILKALYREARVLILDEPTAVLTPMETEALFATLKKLVANGAFGDLHLAQAGRGHGGQRPGAGAARRQARRRTRTSQADTRETGGTDGRRELPVNEVGRSRTPGSLFELKSASARRRAVLAARAQQSSMQLRGGEITGLAGVSGNGQAALAALIAGTLKSGGRDCRPWRNRPANGRRAQP
jgi:ABC-type uncharacterized transport system ATPase subunit